jgi:hypothetical protein
LIEILVRPFKPATGKERQKMCYPDLWQSKALIEMRLEEARASSSGDLVRHARQLSRRRYRMMRRLGHALVDLGEGMVRKGRQLEPCP